VDNKDVKDLIMIVDDIPNNLQIAGNILTEQGFDILPATNGNAALDMLETITPDLILLDIMMPSIDGLEVCQLIKQNERLKNIPIIFLTAKSEPEDIVTGFKLGGVDYITKPFNKDELIVRIKNHIELKKSRERIENYAVQLQALNTKNEKYLNIINKELARAFEYILSILPPPLKTDDIKINWNFKPSIQLGGDAFGYHFIDDKNVAAYLFDVSGHGVGAALHSVSILNTLRFQNLSKTDFKSPREVCMALNKIFQMKKFSDLYFTIWYGCLNLETLELTFASAGHPPAILIHGNNSSEYLLTDNFIIGGVPHYDYQEASIRIKPGDIIYLFSDGAYEIVSTSDKSPVIDDLKDYLIKHIENDDSEIDSLYTFLIDSTEGESLPDDFSILKLKIRG
jgi:phosphoserine phosphatase RsbU/P